MELIQPRLGMGVAEVELSHSDITSLGLPRYSDDQHLWMLLGHGIFFVDICVISPWTDVASFVKQSSTESCSLASAVKAPLCAS